MRNTVRVWVIAKCLALVHWLEPETTLIAVRRDGLYTRAKFLVKAFDTLKPNDPTGEQRRHQVYARLKKEFPDRPWKDIARAIEAAV